MKKGLLVMLLMCLGAWAQAQSRADWWHDPARAGTSLNIAQQGGTLFVAWYRYDGASNPVWLYGIGPLSGNAATLTLYSARGTFLGPATSVVSTAVGSAMLVFQNAGAAEFLYTLAGSSGSLNLARFSFQTIDGAGVYAAAAVLRSENCVDPTDNGTTTEYPAITVNASGGMPTGVLIDYGYDACTLGGSFQQAGSVFRGAGTFVCTGGDAGSWASEQIVFDNSMLMIHATTSSGVTGCLGNLRFAGTR